MSDVERQGSEMWGRVDERKEGARLATFLTGVTAMRSAQAYKQHAYRALQVAEGAKVLDVGCGVGGDVRAIAELIGKTGRVVGLDFTDSFIADAQQRSVDYPTVEYRLGDAHALPFADGAFDAVRSERVFQHLAEPAVALAEMLRVTRAGGRVVVTDPDWDTLVIDLPGQVALERRMRTVITDVIVRNGRIGRELAHLFREIALADIDVTPTAVYVSDYKLANEGCSLEHAAEVARGEGVVSADEAATWINELRRVAATGQFWCALTVFTVSGRHV